MRQLQELKLVDNDDNLEHPELQENEKDDEHWDSESLVFKIIEQFLS